MKPVTLGPRGKMGTIGTVTSAGIPDPEPILRQLYYMAGSLHEKARGYVLAMMGSDEYVRSPPDDLLLALSAIVQSRATPTT